MRCAADHLRHAVAQLHTFGLLVRESVTHAVSSPSTPALQQLSLQNRWLNGVEGAGEVGKHDRHGTAGSLRVIQHLQQVHDLIIHPDVRRIGNSSAHS